MDGDSDGGENVFCILSYSPRTGIMENPKNSFRETVIKFRNNYRKFKENLAKIYKNSAEN